jgi:hypothetical protein
VECWYGGRGNSLRPSFNVIQGKEFLVKLVGFHGAKKPRSLLKVEATKLRGTRPGWRVRLERIKREANKSIWERRGDFEYG